MSLTKTILAAVAGIAMVSVGIAVGVDAKHDNTKTDAPGKTPGFAVVELFTSEGCSSCPPADALLAKLVADARESGTPVYPLAFHVDYWNYLGWSDRFSSAEASQRQKDYAKALASQQIYTPQMIVNGSTEFIGSNEERADSAIKNALRETPAATIKIKATQSGDSVAIKFNTTGSSGKSVVAAVVERGLTTDVARGENGGHTLSHENVVRAFATADIGTNGSGKVTLQMPANVNLANASIIAFVQDPTKKVIVAGTAVDFGK